MDYYYCNDCGAIFNDECAKYAVTVERHWWLDDCPAETLTEMLCPECGSFDIEECSYCEECGEACRPQDLIDYLCEKCR